jgi:ATP-dependent Lon protease
MFTALASLAIGRSVRPDVAMTGEVTLRGLVLPVGGVKEKVLAAKRAGIRTVVLPERNRKDVLEIPAEARKGLNFAYVRNVDDAMTVALVEAPKARGRSVKAPPRSTKSRRLGG